MNTFTRTSLAVVVAGVCLTATACQQKMATQPAPRPYEESGMFRDNQAARPLEKGVVHRNQRLDDDPLVAWLTPEGKKARGNVSPKGEDSFNKDSVVAQEGAPQKVEYFVKELPFEITENDLKRGQTLFNSNCALCHGAAGYGNGKIVERGFLRPPSYHTDPAGKLHDYSTLNQPSESEIDPKTGKPKDASAGIPMGYSRGFYRWGVKVPIKDVPLGYIVQVISWGFGGMAAHDTQVPDPADRWRVAAYVRTLQLSQSASLNDLTPEQRKALDETKPAAGHEGGHK